MSTLVRMLFVWLLVLALPLQGAAAASMVFCGPNHHAGGAPLAAESSAAGDHAHHGHAAAGHGSPADVAGEVVGDPHLVCGEECGRATVQKCSACASCCAMGAILATVPAVPATESAPTVFPTLAPAVEAFATDGPDRPPRVVLA